MIAAFYHGDERASMIGFQSAFQGFGAALMTFVAGQLVQFSWQYTFLVCAISLPILILFVLFVPRPETTKIQVQRHSFSKTSNQNKSPND